MNTLLDLLQCTSVAVEAVQLAFERTGNGSEISEVLASEIYPEIYNKHSSEQKLHELAAIPGFLSASLVAARDYHNLGRDCSSTDDAPSGQRDRSEFMVRERRDGL